MKNFIYEAGLLLFDDKQNDLRALPKTVRLQILVVLSLMWSVILHSCSGHIMFGA